MEELGRRKKQCHLTHTAAEMYLPYEIHSTLGRRGSHPRGIGLI
jgi:hypothetical protein